MGGCGEEAAVNEQMDAHLLFNSCLIEDITAIDY